MTDHACDLLAHLMRRATPRGLVLARTETLAGELDAPAEVVEGALAELVAAGHATVLAPLPFLVCKLVSWSGNKRTQVLKEQQKYGLGQQLHIEVPVSSSAAAATQSGEVGGAGEGEGLLAEVLGVLGPGADRAVFRRLLSGRSPELIRRCLHRVLATRSIRVSRAALFRSLLQRLSH